MLVRGNDVCLNSLLTKRLAGFQAMNAFCSATFDSGVSVTWFWSRKLSVNARMAINRQGYGASFSSGCWGIACIISDINVDSSFIFNELQFLRRL